MGFFSAIKKIFSPKDEELETQGRAEPEKVPESSEECLEDARTLDVDSQGTDMLENVTGRDFPQQDMPAVPGQTGEVAFQEIAGEEIAVSVSEIQEVVSEQKENENDINITRELHDIEREIDIIEDDIHILETEKNDAEVAEERIPATVMPDNQVQERESAAPADNENDRLLVRLREADPRLSSWLGIILEEVEEADDLLWSRLRFLLGALEAPQDEVNAFVEDFRMWLERMEYRHVDEFRSELQYRLALALDLEDEEDERARLMVKLTQGLARTREQFGRRLDELFSSHGELDQAFWDELEELFIMADLGYETSVEMVERLKARAHREKVTRALGARQLLREELEDIFRQEKRILAVNRPEVVLMIGVNGVGKTTTIAKLAHREKMRGKKVLIAAGDTFRAAAIEQLQVWAERVGVEFFSRAPGSDPASVAWEAMDYAKNNDIDVVYIDTAGRLQTKVNLMEELGKIRQVLGKKHPGSPHRSVLVLDATTGQNAISQAKLFKEAAGADELILTKLDGTAKGGVAIAVAMREKLPITFVGLGEKMEDLRPFNGEDYAAVLLGEKAA